MNNLKEQKEEPQPRQQIGETLSPSRNVNILKNVSDLALPSSVQDKGCVCVCARACVRVGMCVCMCMCVETHSELQDFVTVTL